MELIILYGAPGVGKLTVANALARRTGFNVFHNHLTVDMVTSLFLFGSEQAGPLMAKFRIEMLDAAAASNLSGVIHTFVIRGWAGRRLHATPHRCGRTAWRPCDTGSADLRA